MRLQNELDIIQPNTLKLQCISVPIKYDKDITKHSKHLTFY